MSSEGYHQGSSDGSGTGTDVKRMAPAVCHMCKYGDGIEENRRDKEEKGGRAVCGFLREYLKEKKNMCENERTRGGGGEGGGGISMYE